MQTHGRTNRIVTNILIGLTALSWPFALSAFEIETPRVGLSGVPAKITVSDVDWQTEVTLRADQQVWQARAGVDGIAVFEDVVITDAGTAVIEVSSDGDSDSVDFRVIPGWVSVLPAVMAITIALIFRNVIPALLLGLWFGAMALQSFTGIGALRGLLDSFQVFVAQAVADDDHASIILFTMMIGGMVGIITRNGGMASVVRMIVSRAKTAIGGQVAVWLMGLMIFFDDYSNTLVVGNTARSLTDHLKISREKLAYIVDSTAAPVACIALITTWIGYQLGLVSDALQTVDGLAEVKAYSVFLHSIPYSFYAIFAIAFVLIVSVTGKDFGPMYKAEVRARSGQVKPEVGDALPALEGDDLEAKDNIPLRAVNAFVPIIALIIGLAVSLWATGEGDTLTEVLGSADPYKSMMYSSFFGVLVAATITIGQRILSVHETVDAWYGGVRATLFGMIILVLAWSLADVTANLNTADYLVTVLADSLPVALVPASVFILAAITAFTTGTSWGTMGILMPLVIPLTWAVMSVNGMADASGMHILYSSVSCCLVGAVWGDHCSPISDTTVLSSVASGCNHIEHVRTQLPYALIVGAVALLVGTIPGGYGLSPLISLVVGLAILIVVHRLIGKTAAPVAGID
ncbi:MAG: Na+/H+ antiporter NhaC family protein [Gammaproteobacteria bacterium]|nr:Na+/H+ antiporter NhaC family protein [Gammaproteobacteria bacterium]